MVPAHAVITREDARADVVKVLMQAQVSSLQFCVDFPVIFNFISDTFCIWSIVMLIAQVGNISVTLWSSSLFHYFVLPD